MEFPALLVGIGVLFLAGLALETAGRKVHVPRVTLLILLGAIVGPPALDLLPTEVTDTHDLLAPTALTMVAFLLGGSLKADALRSRGREILTISITVVVVGAVLVSGGLYFLGYPLAFALLLGGVAAATDPAAVQDVVREAESRGPFSESLLGIVAIDDAWGLIAFSGALTAATAMLGAEGAEGALTEGLREAGGAVLLGLAVGGPAAVLTGRVKTGEPTLIEALGVVFLLAGLAIWLEISFLLAGMVCGATVTNLARHHERPFHEIERIEWPFLLLFFVLAGASFDAEALSGAGLACVAFIVLRAIARLIGGWIGGRLSGLGNQRSALFGVAMMPQAGVAIGMALVAAESLPSYGRELLAVAVASTIIFEIVGPFFTQFALSRADAQID